MTTEDLPIVEPEVIPVEEDWLATAATAPVAIDLPSEVSRLLSIDLARATHLVSEAERLYNDRMRARFSDLKFSERLKRTNPFLLRIRGVTTTQEWATLQVQSALFASEEEATGHLLEAISKTCFPAAKAPTHPDDFDFESDASATEVHGYQVKMSWDCMPMSSRKNLSNTIRHVRAEHLTNGKEFVGYFAPCYGKARTTQPPGQEYVSLASKEFWARVGSGDEDFDVKVGEVCALLCAEFRREVLEGLVPDLIARLAAAAQAEFGDRDGQIDYTGLFRRINR